MAPDCEMVVPGDDIKGAQKTYLPVAPALTQSRHGGCRRRVATILSCVAQRGFHQATALGKGIHRQCFDNDQHFDA